MKIAVVDDLLQERTEIISIVKDYFSVRFNSYNIAPEFIEFENGESFLDGFQPMEYDLVLLDIYMAELTGIDTARRLIALDKQCRIIFFTTSTDHSLYGYSVHALGYVLKPVKDNIESLHTALDYFMDMLNLEKAGFNITTFSGEQFILFKNIVYIESSLKNLYVHFPNQIIQVFGTFIQYTNILLNDERFLQCYRNLTVNMDYILKPLDNELILKTQEKIPISRRRKADVLEKYTNYLIKRRGY